MKTKGLIMIALIIVLIFSSCNKENSGTVDQESLYLADDDALADMIYDDVYSSADNATIIPDQVAKNLDTKSEFVKADSCPAITINQPSGTSWPKTVTIDYGAYCAGTNDNIRSGKIIIQITAPRLEPGSTRTITFDNYTINSIRVEGTKVLENMGYNNNHNLVISVKLINGRLTLPDGKTIERSLNQQREWISGLLTRNIWDDECLITGTSEGRNIESIAYRNSIMTALHWIRACKFLVSGVVKIERDGKTAVELDFGDGNCDSKAVVTKDGVSEEILLKNKHRNFRGR